MPFKSIPAFPELPKIKEGKLPKKFIIRYNSGDIFATRNFSDYCPKWRKYKRMGWALRYVTGRS